MEKISSETPCQEQEKGYTPRPKWQIYAARVACVLFAVLVLMQIISIARGGL